MRATILLVAALFGGALAAFGDTTSEEYQVDTPALEAKLPVHVKTLDEFVTLGRKVAYSKSYEDVFKLWLRRNAEASADIPAANAWIAIEDDGAALVGNWRIAKPGEENKTTASLHKDEVSLMEAIQRHAMKESGIPKVVGVEVRMVIWSGFPNATLLPTHDRLAMKWTVHLRDGEREAEEGLKVFPATPKEEAKSLGKSGLRLLYIYDSTKDGDDWRRVIQR